MSIGMSYDEFWDGDVALVRAYRKADELRRRRQNETLWLQGRYIYDALCGVSPIFHAFAKKGTKPMPYMDEPYPITEAQIREHKEREARKAEERLKADFAAFAEQMRKKMPAEAHPGTKGGENNVHND
jgi:hypothetical protein